MTNAVASDPMESLEMLSIVCDRFSHAIRTHLGVSMGVVDDLIAGYELSEGEFRDAKRSLQSIVSVLDAIRELANRPSFNPEEINLSNCFDDEFRAGLALRAPLELLLDASAERVYVDRKLFSRALRCLLRYAISRQVEAAERPVVLVQQQDDLMTIVVDRVAEMAFFRRAAEGSLIDLVRGDQSPEALGLLLVDQVFQLHQARVRFTWTVDERLSFQIHW